MNVDAREALGSGRPRFTDHDHHCEARPLGRAAPPVAVPLRIHIVYRCGALV